jgi:hypothetical protein
VTTPDRDRIIREFLDTMPGKKFRFPDEPKWMSGEFLEQREERFVAHRKEHIKKLLVKLGLDEEDTDAMAQLVRDIFRMRGNKLAVNEHSTLPVVINGKTERIDEEMAPLIGRLNDLGIATEGCCQLITHERRRGITALISAADEGAPPADGPFAYINFVDLDDAKAFLVQTAKLEKIGWDLGGHPYVVDERRPDYPLCPITVAFPSSQIEDITSCFS